MKPYILRREDRPAGLPHYHMVEKAGRALVGSVFLEPGYGWTAVPIEIGVGFSGRVGFGGYRRRADAAEALWQDWLADNIGTTA